MASKLWLMAVVLALVVVVESSSLDKSSRWGVSRMSYGDNIPSLQSCHGRVGDCIANDDEAMMGSEISHRQLAGRARRRFISYDVLRKDNVPCNRPGQSYYNCRSNVRANPYNRGCTFITHCARYLG